MLLWNCRYKVHSFALLRIGRYDTLKFPIKLHMCSAVNFGISVFIMSIFMGNTFN